MSSRNLIHQKWEDFSTNMISPHLSDVAAQDMKLAFYCGVQAFFSILVDNIAEESLTQEDAIARLYQVKDELDRYGKTLLKQL